MWVLVLLACAAMTTADVRLPPKIIEQPPVETIFEEDSEDLRMTCHATGIPDLEYSWTKDEKAFDRNAQNVKVISGTGTFIFTKLDEKDVGYYQCSARNMYGTALSQVASLRLAVLDSFPSRSEPVEYPVTEGEKLMVECNAPESYPKPVFTWSIAENVADQTPVDVVHSERIVIDLDGNLHFSNVEPTDDMGTKIYMCNAYNANLRTKRGGSESRIKVTEGVMNERKPELEFHPSNTEVVVANTTLRLQCIFSGSPTPSVSWKRLDGNLPGGRFKTDNYGTVMEISNLTVGDEGQYSCTGRNRIGEESFEFTVDVQVTPVFEKMQYKPHDMNKTEGESASFICNATAEPVAEIQWYKNGEKLDSSNPGPRMSVSDDGRNLTLIDLCKTCNNGQTDLQVIQCNASNVHGYAYTAGYLNVLLKTVLVDKPEDISMGDWEQEVIFPCTASSDSSTPVKIMWFLNGFQIDLDNEGFEMLDSGSLKVDAVILDNQKKGKAAGEYTCEASTEWSSAKHSAFLELPSDPAPVIKESKTNWVLIVIIIVVLILLILLIVLICCLCRQRNMRDEYPVDEKEKAAGLDPERELADNAFHGYERPEARAFKGSQASLVSASSRFTNEDDGVFNEEGSLMRNTGRRNKSQA